MIKPRKSCTGMSLVSHPSMEDEMKHEHLSGPQPVPPALESLAGLIRDWSLALMSRPEWALAPEDVELEMVSLDSDVALAEISILPTWLDDATVESYCLTEDDLVLGVAYVALKGEGRPGLWDLLVVCDERSYVLEYER